MKKLAKRSALQSVSKWILSLALILFSTVSFAQETQNEGEDHSTKTVRIKMVKDVNGETTIIDTILREGDHGNWHMKAVDSKDGSDQEVDIIAIEEQVEEMLEEMEIDIEVFEGKEKHKVRRVVVRKAGHSGTDDMIDIEKYITDDEGVVFTQVLVDEDGNKTITRERVVVVHRVTPDDISSKGPDDRLAIEPSKRSLKIKDLKFSPNPNDGRFNLSFNLPKKEDTEISIHDVSGKKVFGQTLKNFKGNYTENIDISKNAKGVYFLNISQGHLNSVNKILIK